MLQTTRDDGDWESWLKFFLTAVTEVSQEATETARRIVDLRERHRRAIMEHFGRSAGNGLEDARVALFGTDYFVNDIAKLTKVSFTAANGLMRRFVKHGILTEITGQARNRQFRYGQYIDLFADR